MITRKEQSPSDEYIPLLQLTQLARYDIVDDQLTPIIEQVRNEDCNYIYILGICMYMTII